MSKISKNKKVSDYLKYPWQFEFAYCPDEDAYTARVKGLMCYSNGKTIEEATKNIKEALTFHIESCIEDNLPIEPIDEESASGRIAVRTSKKTHLKLIKMAKDENVSVSHLVNDAIIKAYG